MMGDPHPSVEFVGRAVARRDICRRQSVMAHMTPLRAPLDAPRRPKPRVGPASRMASSSPIRRTPIAQTGQHGAAHVLAVLAGATRLIFAGWRAASEGSDRGCVASMSLRGPAKTPRRVRVSRRPNPVRQTQSACPVSTYSDRRGSRSWTPPLGGKYASNGQLEKDRSACESRRSITVLPERATRRRPSPDGPGGLAPYPRQPRARKAPTDAPCRARQARPACAESRRAAVRQGDRGARQRRERDFQFRGRPRRCGRRRSSYRRSARSPSSARPARAAQPQEARCLAPEVFIPAITARAAAQPRPAAPPALAQSPSMN